MLAKKMLKAEHGGGAVGAMPVTYFMSQGCWSDMLLGKQIVRWHTGTTAHFEMIYSLCFVLDVVAIYRLIVRNDL